MKRITLCAALFCFITQFAYSQIQFDVSAGYVQVLSELSQPRIGYFAAVAPSFRLNDKFRFRPTLQFRQERSEFYKDRGSLDLNPEVEYALFDFIAISAGANLSYNLNSLLPASAFSTLDAGLTGALKFKVKNVFGFVRYSQGVVDELTEILQGSSGNFSTTSFSKGYLQLGAGYTFGK